MEIRRTAPPGSCRLGPDGGWLSLRETSAGAIGVMLLEVLTMMAACVEYGPSHYTRIVTARRGFSEAGNAFTKPAATRAHSQLMHSGPTNGACA
ncbi:hypothetical protein [Burkholderia gladioli]|uniref:hypothetical protein n=1 Tax=Burkholderia gladioli TaxID=28095 RepID=UPI0011B26F02|nr:hypothetical protein [Burkholderia gladioli]